MNSYNTSEKELDYLSKELRKKNDELISKKEELNKQGNYSLMKEEFDTLLKKINDFDEHILKLRMKKSSLREEIRNLRADILLNTKFPGYEEFKQVLLKSNDSNIKSYLDNKIIIDPQSDLNKKIEKLHKKIKKIKTRIEMDKETILLLHEKKRDKVNMLSNLLEINKVIKSLEESIEILNKKIKNNNEAILVSSLKDIDNTFHECLALYIANKLYLKGWGDRLSEDECNLLDINEELKIISISEKNNGYTFHYPYFPYCDYGHTKYLDEPNSKIMQEFSEKYKFRDDFKI